MQIQTRGVPEQQVGSEEQRSPDQILLNTELQNLELAEDWDLKKIGQDIYQLEVIKIFVIFSLLPCINKQSNSGKREIQQIKC